MSEFADTPVVRLLRGLARLVLARPRWFLWPQLVLCALCAWYTVANLEFVMDRNSLLDADLGYNRNFIRYRQSFPAQSDLVAVVESEQPEKNRQFVERLAARLEVESTTANPTNLFTDLFYKGDLKLMGRKALLFVPETNLVELRRVLGEYRPFLEQFAGASNLSSLFGRVNTVIRTSPQQTNSDAETLVQTLPALERIVRRAQESLALPGTPPSPGVDALFAAGAAAENRKYITLGEGRIYLVTAKPREVTAAEYAPTPVTWWQGLIGRGGPATEAEREVRRKDAQAQLNERAVHRFQALVTEAEAEVRGVNVGVTGEGVLDYDEMMQSQHDSMVATILSLVLVLLIFIFGYQQTGRPLKATACLIVGLSYTMAFATATVGHLNILTITFVPMLIGLAIDFGVHLITRFEEELRHGRSETVAMTKAMVFTGKGIFTGCLTTAGAFLAMSLTNFRGIREMGIICGGGLVISLIPMLTMLPALLLRRPGRQNLIEEIEALRAEPDAPSSFTETVAPTDFRARLERLWLDRPWTVLGMAAALSLFALVGLRWTRFDYNLLNMQSPALRSVEFEHKLLNSSEKSVIFAAIVATNFDQAIALEAKLHSLPTVAAVESMAPFLAPDVTGKLEQIRAISATIASLRFSEPDLRPVDLNDLSQTLWSLQGYLGLASDEVAKRGKTNLLADITSLRNALGDLRTAMFRGPEAEQPERARKLAGFQQALLQDLRDTIGTLQGQDASGALRPAELPEPLRNRFIGVDGRLLLQVYPRGNIWDRAPQEAFIKDLQSVDPATTGAPVQMYYYTELLKQSYVEAAWWALGATVLLVGLHFRRVSSVLLSLLPVGLGTLWVMGLMGWTGIMFNPANVMMLPLVIGIGITNGIHILNRFAEEKNPGILAKSTGKAVLVSGLTTIAGFGSLLIADHQGIRSLGLVMALGTATCMLAGLTVLPALLTLLERRREHGQTR